MIKNIKLFFKRDSDITYYDEWYYVFITISETIKVIKTRNKYL
jgi:hypothetical protein